MDNPTSRKASLGSKRRSPPPQGRSRPQSPSPNLQSAPSPNVNGSVASSSAYTSRTAAFSRSGYATAPSTDYGPNSAILGQNGNGAGIMGEEPGSVVVDVSAEAQPQYAYSTTLRRQPSMEQGIFPRSSSPHRASPYRQRTVSNPYSNGMPMTGVEEDMGRGREQGFLEKATSYGKRLLGREDYSSVRQEEDGQSERIRRQKETPSSIYAHKTVEVRFAPLQLPVGI
jgi:Ca2+-transporting ATPase